MVAQAKGWPEPEAVHAWDQLTRKYWRPVFACCCRSGLALEDAKDATQDFFSEFICDKKLSGFDAEPAAGRFRCFLSSCLGHFLKSRHRSARAAKRSPQGGFVSMDDSESQLLFESVRQSGKGPEWIFDRKWAECVLESALQSVAEEYQRQGRQSLFDSLKPFIAAREEISAYKALSSRMNKSPEALRKDVQRLRLRFREAIRTEIKAFGADQNEVDEELRWLFACLAGD